MGTNYIIGLDFGQAQQHTAVAVLEQPRHDLPINEEPVYALRHLHRWPPGTPYTQIVPAVAQMVTDPLLRGSPLVVDQTGVGQALVELLRRTAGGWIIPVTITAGQTVGKLEDGTQLLPKKELVTCLQLLLQGRRLRLPRSLPDADRLVKELEAFRAKITVSALAEPAVDWREGPQDDLVLAVALAAWWAEYLWRGRGECRAGEDGVLADVPEGVFLS